MRLGLRASGFGERDANSFHRLFKATQPITMDSYQRARERKRDDGTPPFLSKSPSETGKEGKRTAWKRRLRLGDGDSVYPSGAVSQPKCRSRSILRIGQWSDQYPNGARSRSSLYQRTSGLSPARACRTISANTVLASSLVVTSRKNATRRP